jgi:hypothetical protein
MKANSSISTFSFSTAGSFLICFAVVDDDDDEDDGGGACCTTCTFRFNDGTLLFDFDDILFIYLKFKFKNKIIAKVRGIDKIN